MTHDIHELHHETHIGDVKLDDHEPYRGIMFLQPVTQVVLETHTPDSSLTAHDIHKLHYKIHFGGAKLDDHDLYHRIVFWHQIHKQILKPIT